MAAGTASATVSGQAMRSSWDRGSAPAAVVLADSGNDIWQRRTETPPPAQASPAAWNDTGDLPMFIELAAQAIAPLRMPLPAQGVPAGRLPINLLAAAAAGSLEPPRTYLPADMDPPSTQLSEQPWPGSRSLEQVAGSMLNPEMQALDTIAALLVAGGLNMEQLAGRYPLIPSLPPMPLPSHSLPRVPPAIGQPRMDMSMLGCSRLVAPSVIGPRDTLAEELYAAYSMLSMMQPWLNMPPGLNPPLLQPPGFRPFSTCAEYGTSQGA